MGTCQTRKSTCVRYEMRYRLLAGGAHIHVDFHANRHFDDFWCFPGHSALPLVPDELRPCRLRYCGSKSSPVKSFAWNSICLCCAAKRFSRSCAEGLGQNSVGSSISRLFAPPRMAILDVTGRCRLRIKNKWDSDGPRLRGLNQEPGFRRCRDITSTPVSAMS